MVAVENDPRPVIDLTGASQDPVTDRPTAGRTVAIAHDYLMERGRAERALMTMARTFPSAPIHTILYDAIGTFPEIADLSISASSFDRFDTLRRHHDVVLPLVRRVVSQLVVNADVTLCSSSGWAHGVRTEGRKVVYCHQPAPWLQPSGVDHRRLAERVGARAARRQLTRWDGVAARSADRYLASSTVVRDQVRGAYGIEAEVLTAPPPVAPIGPRRGVPGIDGGYLLAVRTPGVDDHLEVVAAGVASLGHRLVVVDRGSALPPRPGWARGALVRLGPVDDEQMRWLLAHAVAVVSASASDGAAWALAGYGLGTPAVLVRSPEAADTHVEDLTGVWFDEVDPRSVADAVHRLVRGTWRPAAIEAHAATFADEAFGARLAGVVADEAARLDGPAPLLPSPPALAVHAPGRPAGPTPEDPASASGSASAPDAALPDAAVRGAPGIAPPARARARSGGTALKAAVVGLDAVVIVAAMASAFVLWQRTTIDNDLAFSRSHLVTAALLLPCWLAALAYAGAYRARLVEHPVGELRRLTRGVLIGSVLTLAAASVAKVDPARLWLLEIAALGLVGIGLERAAVRRRFVRRRRRGRGLKPTVIVGSNAEAVALHDELAADPVLGYRIVGCTATGEVADETLPVLGAAADTLAAVRRSGATGVILATTAVDLDTSNRIIRELTEAGVHVELSSSLRDISTRRVSVRPVGRTTLMYVEPTVLQGWRGAAKRLFDVVVASVALVLTLPFLLVVALAIKVDSRGPVLFRQRRVGRGGASFELVKLRTMSIDAEARLAEIAHLNEAAWPLFKVHRDPRVTRVGRVLRKLSLDELPQLWNVLKGDMSLVGPRPALPREVSAWTPDLFPRLRVRPGITGIWQVNGRSDATADSVVRLDLQYVDNWTLLGDAAIIARTFPAVLRARGAY